MGLNLKGLVKPAEIGFDDLRGKVLVVDSHNLLYQFLTTIRQSDGTLLLDSKGRVTSHLSGLFSRLSNLLQFGIRLAFVFDGAPPSLKSAENKRRFELKREAATNFEIAKERQDFAEMKKYASRTTRLTPEIIEGSQRLMRLFGCPVIQAASEGEAQAAYIVKREKAFATVSQDFDTLLYSTPNLVRNLSIAGKRRKGLGFVDVKPEVIALAGLLESLGFDTDQLIVLALLIGTDYNLGGIKGIGPKKAHNLVQKHGHDYDAIFSEARWPEHCATDWHEIFRLFKEMPVSDDYELSWSPVDRQGIITFMCDEHDFLRSRIEQALGGFKKQQKGLADFF